MPVPFDVRSQVNPGVSLATIDTSGNLTLAGAIAAAGVVGTSGTTGAANQGRFAGTTTNGAPASGTYAVGDYVLDQNGQTWVCVTAGNPGTWVNPRDTSDMLATGEEAIPRPLMTSNTLAPTSGQLRLTYWTARKTETSTQGRMGSGSTAAGATPTLCRFGVYSIDSSGNGTLVAACANDTTLFAAATTAYTRSWTASFTKTAGQRYAWGVIVVTAAAMPTFFGTSVVNATENSLAPSIAGLLSGQSDLPASFTAGSLSAGSIRIYGAVLP